MAEILEVSVNYDAFIKELEQFDKQMPNVAKKLMRAVNNEVKKQVRKQARLRGYLSRKPMDYGDAGYSKNLKSFADNGYKAKIMFTKNAFQYKFIEYGANVKPIGEYLTFKIGDKFYRSRGFVLPANPLLFPIANGIWGTDKATAIMEKQMQKEIAKRFKE